MNSERSAFSHATKTFILCVIIVLGPRMLIKQTGQITILLNTNFEHQWLVRDAKYFPTGHHADNQEKYPLRTNNKRTSSVYLTGDSGKPYTI